LPHDNNPGNNLLKFSIFIKLKELGFDPIIIGYSLIKNFYFLKKHVKLKVIKKSFFGLNESDYDILMVNSDQTWNNFSKYEDRLLNYGYLKFAENWTIPRFVYGASLGVNYWKFSDKFDTIVRRLLKKFSGISVREIGAIEIVKKHLGINPELVLDPTLLIDKKYYLDLIKDYKNEFNSNDSYIFVYELEKMLSMELFIKLSVEKLKYKLYRCTSLDKDYLKRFIYGIYNCKAVITNSYHGILFSIIFRKPFVAFNLKYRGNDRFNTLIDIYGLKKRIVSEDNPPNIFLLTEPFDVDMKIINELTKKSIDYLKKNLGIEDNKDKVCCLKKN
jgi:hypothetical protein